MKCLKPKATMNKFTYRDYNTGKIIFTINATSILIADEFFEENTKRKATSPSIGVSIDFNIEEKGKEE